MKGVLGVWSLEFGEGKGDNTRQDKKELVMLGRAERLWFLTWVLAEEDEEDGEQGIFRP